MSLLRSYQVYAILSRHPQGSKPNRGRKMFSQGGHSFSSWAAQPPFCYGSRFMSEPGCILLTPGFKRQVIGLIGPRGLFLGPLFVDLCYEAYKQRTEPFYNNCRLQMPLAGWDRKVRGRSVLPISGSAGHSLTERQSMIYLPLPVQNTEFGFHMS